MKRYKIPIRCDEIREVDGVLYTIKSELVKIENAWKVVKTLVLLEEIKDE